MVASNLVADLALIGHRTWKICMNIESCPENGKSLKLVTNEECAVTLGKSQSVSRAGA